MKPVRCEDCNLFFDVDKYASCPHCAAANKPMVNLSEPQAAELSTDPEYGTIAAQAVPVSDVVITETDDVADTAETSATPETEETVTYMPEAATSTEEAEPKESVSIAEAISRTNSTADNEDVKTMAFYDLSDGVNAVAGWIVGTKGSYKGESFCIATGRNNIGRSLTNDVALARETSVSRERHAVITFDPVGNKFFIQAGEGRGLTYLNGELVINYKELKHFDKLSFGISEFIFVALCGNGFSWEDYKD